MATRPLSPAVATVRLTGAAAVVVAFGWLLVAVLAVPRGLDGRTSSIRATSPARAEDPAIHWQSSVVDLRADGLTLRIGDETYTTAGADVVIDAQGYTGQWSLDPSWVEDGQTLSLRLYFRSNGRTWSVRPELWFDWLVRTEGTSGYVQGSRSDHPQDGAVIHHGDSGWVEFEGAPIKLPLGQAYVGDWDVTGRIDVPTCGTAAFETVDVALSLENLRIDVAPRSPSFVEQIGDDYLGRGTMLGDLIHGESPMPEPRLLVCPPPGAPGEGGA